MEDKTGKINKLKEIKNVFDLEIKNLEKEKVSLFKLYSQKLKDKKIEEIKKSLD